MRKAKMDNTGPMNLSLRLEGMDATESVTHDLQDWIEQANIGASVSPIEAPVAKDEMGGILLSALAIILGSKAIVELVKTLHVWAKERKPRLKLVLVEGNSRFEIDAQNLPDLQTTLDRAAQLQAPAGEP